ncbi:MAG TPA: transketolase C-terminal domain-containing protein, partial [Jiangellaceae bacterium]
EEEVALTKEALGWPKEPLFHVPDDVLAHFREAVPRGEAFEREWRLAMARYAEVHPDLALEWERVTQGDLPQGWAEALPSFPEGGSMATRNASGKAINALAPRVPELLGGSADLAASNDTLIAGGGVFLPDSPGGRNVYYGVREHGMGAIMNGMALHGGVRPFGGTFLIFSDYMRPAIRLAALSKAAVVYVFTHDSVGLGEDGPTHQPVEHLAALRAIPGLDVVRPADANETAVAWRTILEHHTSGRSRPAGLCLTRQNVPTFPRGTDGFADAEGVARGGYVLIDTPGGAEPDVILIGTGSEVQLAVAARERLAGEGIEARVVSMPCREWFDSQDDGYRDSVLPANVRARVSVEAAVAQGWREVVGDAGRSVSLEHFGASADYKTLFREFGITTEAVIAAARESVSAAH